MKANDKNHLQWAAELGRLVVTGEAAAAPPPQESQQWRSFGAYPAVRLDGYALWQWLEGGFQSPTVPQTTPGHGYYIRRRE